MLDTNIRAATILGIVGGGGIGYYLLTPGRVSNYDQVTAIVLMILVTVLVVEGLAMWMQEGTALMVARPTARAVVRQTGTFEEFDVAIVGSGIVGLGHALAAVRRGLRVVVVDRSAEITGASVRNFGHLCFTPQAGQARAYARAPPRDSGCGSPRRPASGSRESGTGSSRAGRMTRLAVLADFAAAQNAGAGVRPARDDRAAVELLSAEPMRPPCPSGGRRRRRGLAARRPAG